MYYGARYYDARVSNWLSVDPIALFDVVKEVEHYIDGEHNGGYFNPRNTSVYGYCYQNPVIYVDPNGKQTFFMGGAGNDSDGWNYINRFDKIWTDSGISDFQRVDASGGKMNDILFTTNWRNSTSILTSNRIYKVEEHVQFKRAYKELSRKIQNLNS